MHSKSYIKDLEGALTSTNALASINGFVTVRDWKGVWILWEEVVVCFLIKVQGGVSAPPDKSAI